MNDDPKKEEKPKFEIKEEGIWVSNDPMKEEYPDCLRCNTELIERNKKLICPTCGFTQFWLRD